MLPSRRIAQLAGWLIGSTPSITNSFVLFAPVLLWTTQLVAAEKIVRGILWLRGQRVMLDADLAQLYGVTTKRLNEQVKRNRKRFPKDFIFVLTAKEKAEVVANCDHLRRLKFSPALPRAFTEHGAVMLASVLNSPTAVDTSTRPFAPKLLAATPWVV